MEQPRGTNLARQVTPTHSGAGWELYTGDCADVMAGLQAESVDSIVTSPPYAMQRKTTYGGMPEADYPVWTVRWMNEARRILKPDGSVIINIRPHIKGGVISDYVLRTRLALRDDGWAELEELIWHKKGGAPLGSTKRPRRSYESLLWYGKHGKAYADPKAAGPLTVHVGLTPGSRGRGEYVNSAQRDGNVRPPEPVRARVSDVAVLSTRLNEKSNGLNDHPAPYPWQLAEWCGRLITPPGGTILDPFNGSASTGVAALRNGWNYIGIDAVPEYIEMSGRRLDHEAGKAAA